MSRIQFEWDPGKNAANLKKHGISFEVAHSVFYDDSAIEYYDPEHSLDEDRFLLLGISFAPRTLVVSYCLRKKHIIRIISARKATKKETRAYSRGKI